MSLIHSQKAKRLARKILYQPAINRLFTSVGGKLYANYLVGAQKKRLFHDAEKQFQNGASQGSFEDYKKALEKHWVSFNEYAHQYEFWNLSEDSRNEYVSRLRMGYFYWRYVPGIDKLVFRDKPKFLEFFGDHVYRKWFYVPKTSFDEFKKLVTEFDCIVKPTDATCGQGIFKVYKSEGIDRTRELYDKCLKNRLLIEQCIESCDELKAFHPQSLNTIRIVTFSNKEKAMVFSSRFKIGVGGSVIDNVHAGGLYAQVNIDNGVVETDGYNTSGDVFECHPDTGIKIKGFRIPLWDEIVKTCCAAAKQTNNPITGWDVVVNSDHKVEFIEGNHGPDIDTSQSPVKGLKKKIYSLIKDYYGVEMN